MASKLKTKDKYKKGDKVVYTIEYGASPMLAKSKAEKSNEKVGRISKATKDFLGKPQYVINNITIGHSSILGLAENKQGENTMKITRTQLVELIKEVLHEETEYQKYFKEKLSGKSLGSMSDEEKKAFFADVEKGWKAKGEGGGGEVEETLEPVSQAAGQPDYDPTKRLKAKKRDQILAGESKKVEDYVRKLVREELKFVMFNEVPAATSRKVAKKRILQTGSTTKSE